MDEKAKVRAVSTDLAEIRFELITGSVIVEVGYQLSHSRRVFPRQGARAPGQKRHGLPA